VTLLTGLLALCTGLAYTGLGAFAAYELIRHRRTRGFSHFGLGLLGMAFTCGPHHLLHAYRHLLGGQPAHGPMMVALALGVAPAVLFAALRVEVARGGRGDRLVAGNPLWLIALPCVLAAAGGAMVLEALHHAAAIGVDLRSLIPNAILFAGYSAVGLFFASTQIARRPVLGGWSLSGLAMSGAFLTCGGMHLAAGLLTTADQASVVLDDIGVPAAVYFLWAVYRLHRDSLHDWNRRPLAGRPAPLGRRSPWAEPAA